MTKHTIEEWQQTQAELAIRRWLVAQHLWAPEAMNAPDATAALPEYGLLDVTEIQTLLSTEVVGRIGCHAMGKTYVVPISYVYDQGWIYGHCGVGLLVHLLRLNPEVCFEVDHVEGFDHWRSVMCWGHYEELSGAAAARALHHLIAHLQPRLAASSEPVAVTGDAPPSVTFRIRLTDQMGRFQRGI